MCCLLHDGDYCYCYCAFHYTVSIVARHCTETGQTELDRPGRFCVESYFTESEMQGCPHHKTEMLSLIHI